MQIYKYQLKPWIPNQCLSMPLGAKILAAQWQGDEISIWAQVDPKETTVELRQFSSFATGEELPSNPGKYIATTQEKSSVSGTIFVHHIFETEVEGVKNGNV